MKFCTIASGSSGNCAFAGTDRTLLLVDAGITAKRITAALHDMDYDPSELSGILLTHEHIDHISGLGVLSRKYHIPVYGTAGTIEYIINNRAKSLGKMDPALFHKISPDQNFRIGDMDIHPFRISHDAAQPCGYRLEGDHKSVAVATDLGCYNDYIIDNLRGLDGLLLEANHDVNMLEVGPYPYPLKQRILGERGHLSNDSAGYLLSDVLNDHMEFVLLGHLSQHNNYEALCYATVTSEVTMADNPYKADDFDIEIAHRDRSSRVFEI